jgi:PPK2 family polyphosphate:nucleotide phosphotransferase
MNWIKRLKLPPGRKVFLKSLDPDDDLGFKDRTAAEPVFQKNLVRLEDQQYRLFAEGRRSLLVVLQAMDAAGKDGAIRKVFSAFNPQGCRVTPFKAPTAEELSHDFLWRIHRAAPARGEVAVFNRSHYEDVLVVRVRGLAPKEVWARRYEQINRFESLLMENGTTVVKLFLHISKEEQRQRLEARLNDPARRWKFARADLEERRFWADYQAAYEAAFHRCGTADAPWYVIPANRKWVRNVAISSLLVQVMDDMKIRMPEPRENLKGITRVQ